MLARVDFSQAYWRWLYEPLYQRVSAFALAHNWPEGQVQLRLARLVMGDESLYLITRVDDNTHIKGHCLFSIEGPVLSCEQLEADSDISSEFTDECLMYGSALRANAGSKLQVVKFLTSVKKYRGFEKRYGFTVEGVLMTKEL